MSERTEKFLGNAMAAVLIIALVAVGVIAMNTHNRRAELQRESHAYRAAVHECERRTDGRAIGCLLGVKIAFNEMQLRRG